MIPRLPIVSLLLLAVVPPAAAQQGELTTRDEAAALYSTRFSFNADNVPEVSIALMDDQEEIRFSASGGLRLLPTGLRGPEVLTLAGLQWTARVEGGRPASVRYWVVLEHVPARDLAAVRAARERCAGLGRPVVTVEVGSLFSFFGQVIDSRRIYVVEDEAYTSHDQAQARAEEAGLRYGLETSVHAKLDERSSGTIVLTNQRGTVTVRAREALWLQPEDPGGTVRVRGVQFGRGFSWGGRQDRSYRGTLYLAVDRHGKLAVVNALDAEALLRGIVPTEIYPTAAIDALKAQAVVARGELLAKIGTRHLADPFLLCADVHCQAYSGLAKEDRRTDRAVRETRGEMLFDAGGALVDSVYSASCGGHTEHNEYVWPGTAKGSLRGRFDGSSRPAPAR